MAGLVGVIPAAGSGTRLYPYNGGKELLPVGSQQLNGGSAERPRIISQYIIETMAAGGVEHIIIVTRPDKQNLMALHLDGSQYGVHISYVIQHPPSMAHSIDLAYEWVKSATVVMGMPDTIVSPGNSVSQLLEQHRRDGADLSLGIFPTEKPERFGMVKTNDTADIVYHEDKPSVTDATHMWGLAVWEPSFTEVLHNHLLDLPPAEKEIALGHVFDVMIRQGGRCKAYPIVGGSYYDIGSYDDYKRAVFEL